jgi:hypothetical protein
MGRRVLGCWRNRLRASAGRRLFVPGRDNSQADGQEERRNPLKVRLVALNENCHLRLVLPEVNGRSNDGS